MAKEVAIKIKVDGKEIQVTQQLLDLLKNSAQMSADEIQELETAMTGVGKATSEATQDLDQLDDALKQTKKDTDKLTESVNEAEQEYTSMGERVGKLEDKLATLRLENKEGTEEYKKTAKEIRKLRDVQEELDITTQRTLTTFASIPGPIGFIAGAFESLRVGAKTLRLGMKNLGLGFKTLDKAIMSTGIGALVVLFGLLIAAVVKAFKTFKPLQDAVERFGVLFEVLGDVIQPVVDLIGKALTAALNFLSKAIAFVTGNLDEFNQKLADKAAAEQALAQYEKQRKEFELMGDTMSEVEQQITQAKLDAFAKRQEINEDEKISEAEKTYYIRLVNERLERDITAIQKAEQEKRNAAAKARREKRKAAREQRLRDEQAFQDELTALEQSNELMRIEEGFDRQKKALEQEEQNAITAATRKYNDKEKLEQILFEIDQKYALKRKELQDKIDTDREAKVKENEQRLSDLRAQIRDAEANTEQEFRSLELENARMFYDDLIALAKEEGISTAELEKSKNEELTRLQQEFYQQDKELKEQQAQEERDRDAAMVEWKMTQMMAIAGIAQQVAGILASVAGENKKLAKAAVILEKAAAIGQIVANTAIANAKAVAASPLTFGQPWVTINTISAGVAIAGTIAAAVKAVKEIDGGGSSGGDEGGGEGGGMTSQRGYAKGGMIGGERHAQGGTLIEAEQGEAIMTRGAVSLFGPMLSMMNQMGGGVAFNSETSVTSFDNPTVSNPAAEQSPQIIKSYVVEQELTNSQEQAERLKDLSTL